ncbi:MAG: helix-turn-helix domain-containing protein [Steroidobacteraceae bacterium]|nr:helix-turn-helix domain-containing protein [Steroidobacteraceae bacterium]
MSDPVNVTAAARMLGIEQPANRPLTLDEVAEYLQCSVRTIRREIGAGRLRAVRIRHLTRIDPADLAAYIAGQRERAWPFGSEEPDIKSACDSVTASVLNALSLRERPAGTRSRSKLRSASARSRLHLVGNRRG